MTWVITTPQSSSKKSGSVTVSLDPSSDTGTLGDNVTATGTVRLNLGNLASGGFAWLDKDGNTTFDMDKDILVVNGFVTTALSSGSNTFRFYQQEPGALLSDASYYSVYYDSSLAKALVQQQEYTLSQLAVAYLGRPLTTSEHTVLQPLVAANNMTGIMQVLASNLECQALYTTGSFEAAVSRFTNMMFGRDATQLDFDKINVLLQQGVQVYQLPWMLAQSAQGTDLSVETAKVLFAQQLTSNHDSNLSAAGVSERTLLEVERASVSSIKSLSDLSIQLETLVAKAKNVAASTTQFAPPVATLDAAYDTGTVGDSTTSVASAKLNVTGVSPGAIAWLDNNANGKLDVGVDYPVINGVVTVPLNLGTNMFSFYQMLNGNVSSPGYLAILRSDSSIPTTQPPAPLLDLNSNDDDGTNISDNLTSKNLVRIDVTNIDPLSDKVWIERDGNGIFNLGTDIALATGSTSAFSMVALTEGINGLSAYQTRGGLTSPAGSLTVTVLKSTSVVQSAAYSVVGDTISLEFDRPVNWGLVDTNHDGKLTVSTPGNGGELQLTWGVDKGGFIFSDFIADVTPTTGDWNVLTPTYGSRFLTITDVKMADSDPTTSSKLTILVVGLPDVSSGITSNVTFSGLSM